MVTTILFVMDLTEVTSCSSITIQNFNTQHGMTTLLSAWPPHWQLLIQRRQVIQYEVHIKLCRNGWISVCNAGMYGWIRHVHVDTCHYRNYKHSSVISITQKHFTRLPCCVLKTHLSKMFSLFKGHVTHSHSHTYTYTWMKPMSILPH
jgi:hypothetical protein